MDLKVSYSLESAMSGMKIQGMLAMAPFTRQTREVAVRARKAP
jgi:hypothetical protein